GQDPDPGVRRVLAAEEEPAGFEPAADVEPSGEGFDGRLGAGSHRGTVGQQRRVVAEDHTRFGRVGNRGDEGLRAGEFSSVHASTILGGPAQPLSGSGGVLKSSAPDRTLPQSRTYAGRRVPWHPIATGFRSPRRSLRCRGRPSCPRPNEL